MSVNPAPVARRRSRNPDEDGFNLRPSSYRLRKHSTCDEACVVSECAFYCVDGYT